jgi:SAM-dependent methyltransferase
MNDNSAGRPAAARASATAKGAVSSAARRVVGSERVRERLLRSSTFVEWLTTDANVRRTLEASEQFRAAHHVNTRFGAECDAMIVDVDVSPAELDAAFERVRQTWETVGVDEPHWSVLSTDEFRSERIDDTRGEFYDSGSSHVEQLLSTLQRQGVDPASIGSCLEFGCGVGRMTIWLAREFERVVGCDISQPHLDLARDEIDRQGITNVELLHVADESGLADLPQVDLVYSVIVLQHNPPPIMAFILRRLLDALRPGGLAVIQLPTYDRRYSFSIAEYLAPESVDGILMHVLPQRTAFSIIRDAGCELLEVFADHLAGMEPKTMSNTFVISKPG